MRFSGFALLASALVLGACGGGDTAATDTTTAATPVGATPAPIADVAMAPVTGTTHDVRMVLENGEYLYDPAELTVAQGDGVRFIMVSGAPHNVAFENVPDAARSQLHANISETMGDLSSVMVLNPDEEIMVSFANVPAGTYPIICTPHIAMNMRGVITVE